MRMNTVKINSYAKVNAGLKILNKRTDGYHNISTIFQEIDLHDELTISKNISGCQFSSNVNWLQNDQNNLVEVKIVSPNLPNNHLKYSLTWFSIAISILLIYLYFRKKNY